MQIKEFSCTMSLNDNRVPPQPSKYHCNIEAEFKSMDFALSFHEDLMKLIAQCREPVNMENK